ncbi:MAG: prepilin-type N-terminal cleavage/methylation domain-containing protein [Verrucomicrobiota bacterium]
MIPAPHPIPAHPRRRAAGQGGFTMIEIALCLAIIGFALVAIIGVLPTGLNVQRDNREETIINQDANMWASAIRGGAQGYNDLTNYVESITNFVYFYEVIGTNAPRIASSPNPNPAVLSFGRNYSTMNGGPLGSPISSPGALWLTNGLHIVGLLSRPTIEWSSDSTFRSNYIIANVRAFSGSAADKYPQQNTTVQDSAFSYRMVVDNLDYAPSLSLSGLYSNYVTWPNDVTNEVRHALLAGGASLKANLHDVRLTFRWPLLPTGAPGNGRLSFRASFAGNLLRSTNEVGVASLQLYFNQPLTFVQPQ